MNAYISNRFFHYDSLSGECSIRITSINTIERNGVELVITTNQKVFAFFFDSEHDCMYHQRSILQELEYISIEERYRE